VKTFTLFNPIYRASMRRSRDLWETAEVREAADAANGLVYRSYLPATITTQGRLAKVYCPRGDHDHPKNKRGEVIGWSRGSRKRLLELLNRIHPDSPLPLFVTLTFPDFFPDQRTARRNLDSLSKRWERDGKGWAFIWRMEVIRRKSGRNAGQVAPHFHLLVFTGGQLADLGQLSRDWFDVVASGDYAHLRAGTKAEFIRTWNGVMHYAAKYLSKEPEGDVPVTFGRVWGVYNRRRIPLGEAAAYAVSKDTAKRCRRTIRRMMTARQRAAADAVRRMSSGGGYRPAEDEAGNGGGCRPAADVVRRRMSSGNGCRPAADGK